MRAARRRQERTALRRRLRDVLLFLGCWLAVCDAGFGGDRLRFRHLTVEGGLSNSWVQDVLQDRQGFLWFATADGLDRYDGVRFRVFRPDTAKPDAIAAERVDALLEDQQGRIWLGLNGRVGGLGLYDPEKEAFRCFPLPSGPGSTSTPGVQGLAEDRRGRLWLATAQGLYRFDPRNGTWNTLRHDQSDAGTLSADDVHHVAADPRGFVWAATAHGLDRIDPDQGRVRRWPLQGDAGDLLASVSIHDVYVEPGGTLWAVSREAGLFRVDDPAGRARRYRLPSAGAGGSDAPAFRVKGDGKSAVYVGTENGGLYVLDTQTGAFMRYRAVPGEPHSLGADSIYSLFIDRLGSLWVGTYNAGVDYASRWERKFDVIRGGPDGLSGSHVSAVIEDRRGDLWVGTDGEGLNRVDSRSGRVVHYRHPSSGVHGLASDAVMALHEDERGCIWIGTWEGGLQSLDPESGHFATYLPRSAHRGSTATNDVWTIADRGDGRLLVGFQEGGVRIFDPRTGAFRDLTSEFPALARDSGPVRAVLLDPARGGVWLGHDFAEFVDRRSGRVTAYQFEGSVVAMHLDSRGNVWFATESGLYSLPLRSSMKRYTTAAGLPSDSIVSILEDATGALWLGTRRGLVQFEDAIWMPDSPRLRSFDVRDGLPGYELNVGAAVRNRGGRMFFGAQRGLISFLPQDLAPNPHVPPVVITDLRILNQSIRPGPPGSHLDQSVTRTSQVVLRPRDSVITLDFAALDFVLPRRNQYRYRLDGFDQVWRSADERAAATYTSIPPGTYRFQVKASNGDGAWNETGAVLTIVQLPPFYRTRWFLTLMSCVFVGGVSAAHWLRVRRHQQLESQLQERIRAARAEIRTLSGLLPICTGCGSVRDDQGYWSHLEAYLQAHSEAAVSHGICPQCRDRMAADQA